MSAADLPIAALRLHPQTERALIARGIATAGQLAALAELGLDLRPGRTYARRQSSAAKPARPAPAPAALPAPPPAPAIPPLPKLSRIRVRVQTP